MRISDWSSDVCSSDLRIDRRKMFVAGARNLARGRGKGGEIAFQIVGVEAPAVEEAIRPQHPPAAEGADARWHGDRPFDLLHRPRPGRSGIDPRPPVDLRLEDLAHALQGLRVPCGMAPAARKSVVTGKSG